MPSSRVEKPEQESGSPESCSKTFSPTRPRCFLHDPLDHCLGVGGGVWTVAILSQKVVQRSPFIMLGRGDSTELECFCPKGPITLSV